MKAETPTATAGRRSRRETDTIVIPTSTNAKPTAPRPGSSVPVFGRMVSGRTSITQLATTNEPDDAPRIAKVESAAFAVQLYVPGARLIVSPEPVTFAWYAFGPVITTDAPLAGSIVIFTGSVAELVAGHGPTATETVTGIAGQDPTVNSPESTSSECSLSGVAAHE